MSKLVLAILAMTVLNQVRTDKTVYFEEKFSDEEEFKKRWTDSTFRGSDQGKFKLSYGQCYGDTKESVGLQTSEDNRFYGISTKFEPFSNENKTLVLQFNVKHEQKIECGGGYIKLFSKNLDQKNLNGDTQYYVMFGPDICGTDTKKLLVIFNYQGKNLVNKKEISCKDDHLSHLYTLIIKPDNTYIVKIDNEKVESGKLKDNWDFVPVKKIPDPNVKKPADWDENEKIVDPNDKKPEDWDKPEMIPDPNVNKPDTWDDDVDGDWVAPTIRNPEYKGEWKPKLIDNPNYKGPWIQPEIDNPDYKPDELLYRYNDIGAIGIDIWQVKSGTIFDNILITDDENYAEEFSKQTWGKVKDGEKKMRDMLDEEERKKEDERRKKFEEERKERDRDRDRDGRGYRRDGHEDERDERMRRMDRDRRGGRDSRERDRFRRDFDEDDHRLSPEERREKERRRMDERMRRDMDRDRRRRERGGKHDDGEF